jgi:phosphonoacetate hydrolase
MKKPVQSIVVENRAYAFPERPLVVVCCDGSEPDYMETAMAHGLMPNLVRMIAGGEDLRGLCAMPSFTNPNNLSIATGQPPAVHGICGNYLIDPETGQETMMNDPRWLRASTIFSTFQRAGARVCVITAKDKLRLLLGHGLVFDGRAMCFSAEKADHANLADNGIENVCAFVGRPVPEVYSADLSEFVFAAGALLLKRNRPDLMYLSTTDYIQHKFAPGSDGANSFYAMMDHYLGELHDGGATVIVVADHGMKNKHLPDGSPDVLYLQDFLDLKFGTGRTKVILPITDPYVVHHGALGSFATVYLNGLDAALVRREIDQQNGIDVVHTRDEACRMYDLPADRIGDLVVISGGLHHTKVLGTSRSKHDLSGLDAPLRSHGGLSEQRIPFICNRKLRDVPQPLHNYDAFYVGCNCLAGENE